MENIIEIRDLKKKYRSFLLDGISLELPRGRIMGIIGPNGAGKTTTIKIMMNMVRADKGEVRIFGLESRSHNKTIKNRVGYVGEEPYFYADKTVAWTGGFVSSIFQNWDTNLFEKMLMNFKISRTKRIRELSKGMKVKLTLALALAHDPDLFILDEPTAGLDPVIRREVLELLRVTCQDKGKSVIISSHITDDITRIADYVTFLIDGKIALTGEKDLLLSQWKRIHFRKGTQNDGLWNRLMSQKEHMFGCSGVTRDYPTLKAKITEGLDAGDIKVENVNLDDILIALVKGE